MTKILIEEATLKLAMEALNTTESDCGSRAWEREQEAITAIKQALAAQPAVPDAIHQPTRAKALNTSMAGTTAAKQCWR
jgi:uncharacterized protein (DUF2461 family)